MAEINEKDVNIEEGGAVPGGFPEEYRKTFFGGGGGGGGGGGIHFDWGKMLTIFLVIGIILIVVVWFVVTGGLQAGGGVGYQLSQGFSGILTSTPLRALSNWIQNPFSITPTGGGYEELPPADTSATSTAPNQAFTIDTRGMVSTVEFNQKAISFFITVNNAGAQKISKIQLYIDSGNFPGCLRGLPDQSDLVITDLGPYASKGLSITGAWINGTCVAETAGALNGGKLIKNVQTPVYISIKGDTYYTTSSRLAVERIRSDYGMLLLQNGLLRQESVGAVYQSGTALSINLDAGNQPILDSVNKTGLLMNWINNGGGKIPSNLYPFLFIITPEEFSPCVMTGMKNTYYNWDYSCNDYSEGPGTMSCSLKGGCVYTPPQRTSCILCDPDLNNWCSASGTIFKDIIGSYSNSSTAMFDWACRQRGYVSGGSETCGGPGTNVTSGANDICVFEGGICGPNSTNYAASLGAVCKEDNGQCMLDCTQYTNEQTCDKYYSGNLRLCSWGIWNPRVTSQSLGQVIPSHVCGTNVLTQEFNTFSCALDLSGAIIPAGENRHTYYITALAVYPYEVSASDIQLAAYCAEPSDYCT
jgi:hypothetical protein